MVHLSGSEGLGLNIPHPLPRRAARPRSPAREALGRWKRLRSRGAGDIESPPARQAASRADHLLSGAGEPASKLFLAREPGLRSGTGSLSGPQAASGLFPFLPAFLCRVDHSSTEGLGVSRKKGSVTRKEGEEGGRRGERRGTTLGVGQPEGSASERGAGGRGG